MYIWAIVVRATVFECLMEENGILMLGVCMVVLYIENNIVLILLQYCWIVLY